MTGAIEKVYSTALYELASEEGNTEKVCEELKAAADAFAAEPDIYEVLAAPTVSDTDKTKIIESIFGEKVSPLTLDFLCLITRKGRIRHLQGFSDALRILWETANGITEVTVTTVSPLTAPQRDALKKKLEEKYNKKIIMSEKTDPSILGGVIVNFGDTMLDGSVKTKLDNMKRQLMGNRA